MRDQSALVVVLVVDSVEMAQDAMATDPVEMTGAGEMVIDLVEIEIDFKRNLFKRDAIEDILHSHTSTDINFSPHIWALLTLELWFEEFFKE